MKGRLIPRSLLRTRCPQGHTGCRHSVGLGWLHRPHPTHRDPPERPGTREQGESNGFRGERSGSRCWLTSHPHKRPKAAWRTTQSRLGMERSGRSPRPCLHIWGGTQCPRRPREGPYHPHSKTREVAAHAARWGARGQDHSEGAGRNEASASRPHSPSVSPEPAR